MVKTIISFRDCSKFMRRKTMAFSLIVSFEILRKNNNYEFCFEAVAVKPAVINGQSGK